MRFLYIIHNGQWLTCDLGWLISYSMYSVDIVYNAFYIGDDSVCGVVNITEILSL